MFMKNTCCLVVELGDDPVGFFNLEAIGIGWTGAARKDGQQQDFGIRKILAELQDNGADAFGDFRAGGAAGIIGADHEHDGLGLVALALTVLQAPEDALGGVARDAEIGDLHIAEILIQDTLAARIALRIGFHIPQVGDGIAVEEDVEIAGLGGLDEGVMPTGAYAGGRANAGIVTRDLKDQERSVLLQQVLVGGRIGVDELLQLGIDLGDFLRGGPWHRDFRRHGSRRPGRRKLTAPRAAGAGWGGEPVCAAHTAAAPNMAQATSISTVLFLMMKLLN